MKATISYPVLTTGTPARTNRERLVLLRDVGTFDIAEYGRREIDVAASIHDNRLGHETRLLGFEGHPYAQLAGGAAVRDGSAFAHVFQLPGHRREDDWLCAGVSAPIEAVLRQLRYDHGTQLETRLFPPAAADVLAGRSGEAVLPRRLDFEFKQIDESAFDAMRPRMEAAVADLMLVDGALWRRCHTPTVALVPREGNPERRVGREVYQTAIHRDALERARAGNHDLKVLSGFNDQETALELAREALRTRHDHETEHEAVRPRHTVTVHDPSAFEEDCSGIALLHCAQWAVRWMSGSLLDGRGPYDNDSNKQQRIAKNLRSSDLADIVLLKSLADAVEEAARTDTFDGLTDLVRAASNSAMLLRATHDDGNVSAVLSLTAERWDARPISFYGDGPAPGI